MAVRSNYIKQLMEKKNSLDEQYQEVIAESMKNIIGENAKDEVRQLLKEAEDEDTFEEEEVGDDTATTDEEDTLDAEKADDATEDDEIDDELWNDLEDCKSADGEYDCRGMEDEKLVKVLKAMGPEDGIRVMSNGDGTVEIEVDGDRIEGTQEFILDLDDNSIESVEDDLEDDFDGLDEGIEYIIETNTGYTDNYQKDTAMTTPDNHEPANPKTTYSMDAGVPKGTAKPWAQDGDRQPYEDDVNECGGLELEVVGDDEETLDETMTSTENNPTVRGTGMTHQNTNKRFGKQNFRNGRTGEGGQVKGTGQNSYSGGETNETLNFKRSMNRLYEENKQMKSIIPQLNKKLTESMVINASMGYIVRLINENTTTSDEKKEISQRFAKVNTLEEGKKLYQTISEELKRANKRNNIDNTINAQLAEGKQSKQSLVETTMYKSEKVNEALDFMKRLDKIQ